MTCLARCELSPLLPLSRVRMQVNPVDEADENGDDEEELPPVLPAAAVAAILFFVAYADNCKLPRNCPFRVCLFFFLRPVGCGVGCYRARSSIGNGGRGPTRAGICKGAAYDRNECVYFFFLLVRFLLVQLVGLCVVQRKILRLHLSFCGKNVSWRIASLREPSTRRHR